MKQWKPVKGYEGHYEISNYGDIRSLKNQIPKELSKRYNADGYCHYSLRINGKSKEFMAHRLVIKHFSDSKEKETVNHIDGDKKNNYIENLEWADRGEQMIHAYKNGLKKSKVGFDSYNAIMTEKEVLEIRSLYIPRSKEFGMRALARKYKVSDATIDRIVRNINYKMNV